MENNMNQPTNGGPATTNKPTTIDERVDQYVRLRDMIKAMEKKFEEDIKPYKHALEGLNALLLKHLNNLGVESARTTSGTVYRCEKVSASIADPAAFWDYVVSNNAYDLIDKRVNKTAATDHVNEKGTPPPGVNYSVQYAVGVRRS